MALRSYGRSDEERPSPQRRGRGRPPRSLQPLSRDGVLREALALLDQEGLAKVSVRKLAARLGVTPMSLYNHFASKDALFDALHDAVLLDVTMPAFGRRTSWRHLAEQMARALREALRAHPQALPLFATRPVRSPVVLRTADKLLQQLLGAGFGPKQAIYVLDCVVMFTTGHALAEFGVSPAAAPERDGRDLLSQRVALLEAGLHCLVRVAEEVSPHDYNAEFEWGLCALLEGCGRRLR
jgi:TetR/AcrR family transcriptional regulator, tetracycline repressor protein